MTDLDRQILEACDRFVRAKEEKRPTGTIYREMRTLWSRRVKARASARRAAQKVAA